MRYIIVSPNEINDPYVYKIGQLRYEFMQNARLLDAENQYTKMDIVDFNVFDNRYEDQYATFDEKKILNGTWASVQLLNEAILPDIRKTLLSLIQDRTKDIVHVDLGKSLLTLYVAYFAIVEELALNITFHVPNPEDKTPTFNIGGESAYSNPRNNLRRYLATQIINNAMTVFIDDPRIVGILNRLFPRINREIHIDPMVQIEEEEEQELQNATAL
jgi:hypothetical protein